MPTNYARIISLYKLIDQTIILPIVKHADNINSPHL